MIPYKYGTGLERTFELETEMLKDLGRGIRAVTKKASKLLRRRHKR